MRTDRNAMNPGCRLRGSGSGSEMSSSSRTIASSIRWMGRVGSSGVPTSGSGAACVYMARRRARSSSANSDWNSATLEPESSMARASAA